MSSSSSFNLDVRSHQLSEESEHQRSAKGNQRALLSEKLESLRELVKDIKEDDWKYEVPKLGGIR